MNLGDPEQIPWQECFCSSCRTLLFRTVPAPGMRVMMRCRRCNAINVLHIPANGVEPDEMKHLLHRIDDHLLTLLQATR